MMMIQEGLTGEVTGGYFIRRAGPIPARLTRNSRPVTDNTENIDPLTGRVIGSTRQRQRRSPLPDWYPRIPLKDITAIIQAIDRRDQRIRAEAEAAAASQTEQSALPAEQQTPEPANQIASTPPLALPPIPHATPEQEAYEKKLSESIEKIEKLVRQNLKRDVKKTKAVQRDARVKALILMR